MGTVELTGLVMIQSIASGQLLQKTVTLMVKNSLNFVHAAISAHSFLLLLYKSFLLSFFQRGIIVAAFFKQETIEW